MGNEEKEISVEELQKENEKLKKKVQNLQNYIQEILNKVQTFSDAMEMQKKGLMTDLSETVQNIRQALDNE